MTLVCISYVTICERLNGPLLCGCLRLTRESKKSRQNKTMNEILINDNPIILTNIYSNIVSATTQGSTFGKTLYEQLQVTRSLGR
jgi:predicted methyltransferase